MEAVALQPTTETYGPPSNGYGPSPRDMEAAYILLELRYGHRLASAPEQATRVPEEPQAEPWESTLPYRPASPRGPVPPAPSTLCKHLQDVAKTALGMNGPELTEEALRGLHDGGPVPEPPSETAAVAGSPTEGEHEAPPRDAPQQEQVRQVPAGEDEGHTGGADLSGLLTAGSKRHPLPKAKPKTKAQAEPKPKPKSQSQAKPKDQPKVQPNTEPKTEPKPQRSRKRKMFEKEDEDEDEDEEEKKAVLKGKEDEDQESKPKGSPKKKAKKGPPVVCDECVDYKEFPRMDHLVRHKKTVHGFKTDDGTWVLLRDECDVCQELFTRMDNLQQHRKKRHEETAQVSPLPKNRKDRPNFREVLIRKDNGTRYGYVPAPGVASPAAAAAAPGGTQAEVQPEVQPAQPEGSPAPEDTESGSGTVSSETVESEDAAEQ